MTDGVDDRPDGDPAEEAGDDRSGHLRIIPPDGTGEPDPDAGRHSDDPAHLPLPAMAPGTGGSRLDRDDFESETQETTQVVREPSAPTAEVSEDTAEVSEDTAEVSEDPAEAAGSAEEPTEDAGASTREPAAEPDEATETAQQPIFPPPPGVSGVRLHRAPPLRQAPIAAGPTEPGAGAAAADDSPLIRVSADRIPESPLRGADDRADADAGRHALRPEADAVQAPPESRPNPWVKILTGVGFGIVALVVILMGKTAFAGLVLVLVTWVSVEFFGALYASLAGDEEALDVPGGSAGDLVPPVGDGDDATAAMKLAPGDEASSESPVPGLSIVRRPAAYVAVAGTRACALTTYLFGVEAAGAVVAGTVLGCLIWFTSSVPRGEAPLEASLSVLGFLHIGLLGTFAMLMLRLQHGMAMLLVVVILSIVCDVSAYGWGSSFGRTPFFSSVSPHKSLEGFLGSLGTTLVAAVIVVALQGWMYDSVAPLGDTVAMLVLAFVVVVAGTFGDLAESLFKRDLAIKDVAALLPGHGGFFDRLDALLFALPAAYVVLRLTGLADVG